MENLEKVLKQKLDLLILANTSKTPSPVILPQLKLEKMGKEDLLVYLIRPCDLDKVRFYLVEELDECVIDSLYSPVIEFDRCYINKNKITRGRMYYVTGYYDENDEWIEKESEFLDWAQKLFKIAKKSLKRNRDLDAYVGEDACLSAHHLDIV